MIVKKFIFSLFFIAATLIFINAFADDKNQLLDFSEFGITYKLTDNQLKVWGDKNKIISSIPVLQKLGILNPDINQTTINTMPISLSSTAISFFLPNMTEQIFKNNSDLKNIHGQIYLVIVDEYGNDKKHLVYSFDFSRNTYNKINWKGLEFDGFTKLSNLEPSDWLYNKMQEEANQ